MKRTIKFRGKRVDTGEWMFGYFLCQHNMPAIMDDEGNLMAVQPETVGQFTSLKDKNGVEIYEGDILRVDKEYFLNLFRLERNDSIGQVWHDDEIAGFNIGDLRDNIIPRKDLAAKYFEVVGNIYNNPELLTD